MKSRRTKTVAFRLTTREYRDMASYRGYRETLSQTARRLLLFAVNYGNAKPTTLPAKAARPPSSESRP